MNLPPDTPQPRFRPRPWTALETPQDVELWIDEHNRALQELVKRVKESPEPFLRYGDFLITVKKDPETAIEQYRQALIWRPDDEATRAKVAGIYVDMGAQAYAAKQYAVAQSRFNEAAKYVTDKSSPQGLKVQDYQGRLREIRGR